MLQLGLIILLEILINLGVHGKNLGKARIRNRFVI
jgi:hypothetical protein